MVNTALTLSQRTWTCGCGAVHDRDRNAAQNLLAAMHANHVIDVAG
ncbi:zinc ribbon domain-containing protein [Asanoa siamensis]